MKKKSVNPRLIIVGCLLLVFVAFVTGRPGTPDAPAIQRIELRCGWFSNPTPGNSSLYDRDAEWILGVQGGHQAEGDWPPFGPGQWVKTNDLYGYGCACLRVRANHQTHEVMQIVSARARPLSVCRQDRSLRRWGFR